MRLRESPVLPGGPESVYDRNLNFALTTSLREIAQKVNQIAAGTLAGFDGTATSPPTTGTWAIGDFVRKSNPVEAGAASSKYIITGWLRLTDGGSNVLNTDWFECRVLTGN